MINMHTNKNLGYFDKDVASYTIKTLNLPTSWDYIYKNEKILLRVDQHGPVMAQVDPPGGIVLFRREYMQRYSSWIVWITSPSLNCNRFTNFFRPCPSISAPSAEPDEFTVKFSAIEAVYTVKHEGLCCETTFNIHPTEPAILMCLKLTNLRNEALELNIFPALRTYVNPAQLAPWDKPEWYLKTTLFKHSDVGFLTQLMNMNAQPEKRRYVVFGSIGENLTGAENYYEKFVGQGNFDNPESVFNNSLRLKPEDARLWGISDEANTACCYPPVNALHYQITLQPQKTWELSQVLSLLPNDQNGTTPDIKKVERTFSYLNKNIHQDIKLSLHSKIDKLISTRSINTGQVDFDRYVNKWLPLLLDWVCSLDRGWPSGMRGCRDAANDFTAMIPIEPQRSRRIILELMECQRTDGWFPRQYSVSGRKGKHDLRKHVDAGCWVIELLYEYICYTKDIDIFKEKLPWLDSDNQDSVLEHLFRSIEFFINPENLGEHGICKIGEGDWNDAVNLAGLKGRGESVMVSCQTVIALTQIIQIVEHLKTLKITLDTNVDFNSVLNRFVNAKTNIIKNLQKHAYNSEGYFNSVFNDSGNWIFSPHDPDGQRRISGPANWYAIISGVADRRQTNSILKELEYLRCEQGYRLFYPPFSGSPIENIGRIATGDQLPGVFENGTVYNQGSHGFLSRALAVAGRGNLLYEVIRKLLPFDQDYHPTETTFTAPFAVVNCWLRVPGFMGRGGLTFLTGSIAMGLRAVYDWMFGIRPALNSLIIDPCIPSHITKLQAQFQYAGKPVKIEIINNNGSETGVANIIVNGCQITESTIDPFNNRKVFLINDTKFSNQESNIIIVQMN